MAKRMPKPKKKRRTRRKHLNKKQLTSTPRGVSGRVNKDKPYKGLK